MFAVEYGRYFETRFLRKKHNKMGTFFKNTLKIEKWVK